MTKPRDESKQLQLRLLVDVNSATSHAPVEVEARANAIRSGVATAIPASEKDMAVYRGISGNYFRSLRKD